MREQLKNASQRVAHLRTVALQRAPDTTAIIHDHCIRRIDERTAISASFGTNPQILRPSPEYKILISVCITLL
jgi:hypothetical protein